MFHPLGRQSRQRSSLVLYGGTRQTISGPDRGSGNHQVPSGDWTPSRIVLGEVFHLEVDQEQGVVSAPIRLSLAG